MVSDSEAAKRPAANAPSAAVAVQPYHHISGARNSMAGIGDVSRAVHARQEGDAERGIDGEDGLFSARLAARTAFFRPGPKGSRTGKRPSTKPYRAS